MWNDKFELPAGSYSVTIFKIAISSKTRNSEW